MKIKIANFLAKANATLSMSEGRRLISMGAVRVNGEEKTDTEEIEIEVGDVIQIGKRRTFVVRKEMLL